MVTPSASVRSSSRRSNRPQTARLPRNGAPVAHALFFAERDHVDAERQASPAQGLHGRDGRAKRPARRRTCRHPARCPGASRSQARATPAECRRNDRSSCPRHRARTPMPGLFHPLGQPAVQPAHRLAEKGARDLAGFLRERGDLIATRQHETRPRPPGRHGASVRPVVQSSAGFHANAESISLSLVFIKGVPGPQVNGLRAKNPENGESWSSKRIFEVR